MPCSVIVISGIVSKFPLMLQLLLKTSLVISDLDENAILNCLLRISTLSTGSGCKTPSDLRGGMVLLSALLC